MRRCLKCKHSHSYTTVIMCMFIHTCSCFLQCLVGIIHIPSRYCHTRVLYTHTHTYIDTYVCAILLCTCRSIYSWHISMLYIYTCKYTDCCMHILVHVHVCTHSLFNSLCLYRFHLRCIVNGLHTTIRVAIISRSTFQELQNGIYKLCNITINITHANT